MAEAYRNLTATGAVGLATTDNLNFGNPERPEIMGQLVGCIKGIAEAVAGLGMPIVSGNVSLYNETEGEAILPTPTIGAVGLLGSIEDLIRIAPHENDVIVLVGTTSGHLGQSSLLYELHGVQAGDAPDVDLSAERVAGACVLEANQRGLITAAHDLSDGGLAIAATEMAIAGQVGAIVRSSDTLDDARWFYGEDQGRYLLACAESDVDSLIDVFTSQGVTAVQVGQFTGENICLGNGSVPLNEVAKLHDEGLQKLVG